MGLNSLSGKTSYRQISWSLKAVRLNFIMITSFWNLTGTSAALLLRCLSNFRVTGKSNPKYGGFWDVMRSCHKKVVRLVKRGPGILWYYISMSYCKKNVTPLLRHWSYIFLALSHRYSMITTSGGCGSDHEFTKYKFQTSPSQATSGNVFWDYFGEKNYFIKRFICIMIWGQPISFTSPFYLENC